MEDVVRVWFDSEHEVPHHQSSTVNKQLVRQAENLTQAEAVKICEFLGACRNFTFEANRRNLWKTYNMTLCLWLYRRLVWQEDPSIKVSKFSPEAFSTLLSGLVNEGYCARLVGKSINSRSDRVATYKEMRSRLLETASLVTVNGRSLKRSKLPVVSCVADPKLRLVNYDATTEVIELDSIRDSLLQ
jgi:hypothetical protein